MKTILILGLLGLSACATSPSSDIKTEKASSMPSWVNQPQASYPEVRYLVAVGNGRDRNAAIEDAKKQMAESFVVKVKSEMQSKAQSSLNQSTSGSLSGDTNENVSKDLSLTTETSLRGAEIKEVSEVGSEFYALLALDKMKARSGLLMEANRLKAKLNGELESLEEAYTHAKMTQAKDDLASLYALYNEAAALGMSALIEVSPLEARLNKIENAVRNKNAKIIFAVKTVKGEDYFERDIQSCINDRGGMVYTIEQAPANANQVKITVVERAQHLPVQGWIKIRFDLTAAIVQNDGKMFRIQATRTETGRSREAVLEAVSDQLSRDLCESLFNRMNEAR